MKMKRALLSALGLLALVATPVVGAYFPNFPLVGGAAYCGSYATGTTGQVCTVTVSAGPSIVTGDETVLMDTNLSQGRQPQTVKVGLGSLNALPVSFETGSTTVANTVTAATTSGGAIMVGSGALSPVTLTLPPTPIDGQEFKFSSNQTIASLTVAGAGGASVVNNPTALTVSTTAAYGYHFKYRASNTSWYRVQ